MNVLAISAQASVWAAKMTKEKITEAKEVAKTVSRTKEKITKDRLATEAKEAAKKVLKATEKLLKIDIPESKLTCKYVGTVEEDAPLHCNTRVNYEWKLEGCESIQTQMMAAKALHLHLLVPPASLKMALMVSSLPVSITEHRSIPPMMKHKKGDVVCRAIAIPKSYDDECNTTFLNVGGRRVEYLICAHISGDQYLLHPGRILHQHDMFKSNVEESSNKAPRLNAPTKRIESLHPCSMLNKLMAIAHFQAEIERAEIQGRSPDMNVADEKFEKNSLEWGKKTPKQVFVLWTSKTEQEGGLDHHLNEVVFTTLSKSR